MIRSILVLLDGSAFSAQVIPCAVSAARALNAHIEFVQVHIPAYPHSWLADVAEDDLRWELETQQQEREELERVAARVTAEWGIPARFQLLEGEVVASIVHRAREVNAVMIVLATHGRTGFSRAVFGSLADRMIPLSQIPILLFHPRQELEAKAAVEPFGHILIPLDGSPLSETAIPFALTLGRTTAKYTLMRVVPSADLLAVSPPVLAALRDPRDTKKDQDAMQSRPMAGMASRVPRWAASRTSWCATSGSPCWSIGLKRWRRAPVPGGRRKRASREDSTWRWGQCAPTAAVFPATTIPHPSALELLAYSQSGLVKATSITGAFCEPVAG
jgi:nucleotide-binding universal stress UspA family protein